MPVSEKTYEQVALEDVEGSWELVCGHLRKKPAMTMEHNEVARLLGFFLQSQLPLEEYRVSVNVGRVRIPGGQHFVPGVMVIPVPLMQPFRAAPGQLEAYENALPLVVEVWSPSTGDYDIDEK